jgi:hypothetical protein
MRAVGGITIGIEEESVARAVSCSASSRRITPLTPRSELARVFTRSSIAILLILSDLADAAIVSRGLDDIAVTSLEVEPTSLNSINITTRCRSPLGPITENTVDRARDSVARH